MECYRIKNGKEKLEMLQLQKRVFSDYFSQDITLSKARKQCSENYSEQHYSINDTFSELIVQRNFYWKPNKPTTYAATDHWHAPPQKTYFNYRWGRGKRLTPNHKTQLQIISSISRPGKEKKWIKSKNRLLTVTSLSWHILWVSSVSWSHPQ